MSPSPNEMNVRLQAVEKTSGESLLEIRHTQAQQGTIIQQLQLDMHKLVQLNETQILLQERQQEASKAVERSFAAIQGARADLVKLIEANEKRWQEWRDRHESDNANTAQFATAARGGLRVLGVLGLVLWGLLGWLALDWRNTLQGNLEKEALARREFDASATLRFDAQSSAIQENRIRLEEHKRETHQ